MPRPSPSRLLPLLLIALLPAAALAQTTSLRGRFEDAATRAAVPGVEVKLTSLADTSQVHRGAAREDGTFEITGLGVHSYRLEATRLGYAPLRMVIRVTQARQDAGAIALTPQAIEIGGVDVSEDPAPAIQKGDTTEFRAGAVKTHRDATAEDLVQKLPGVTMENGQVKAQGEDVRQVLVNGRPFFGSDPTAAMRNLPAEVVDRIQVYDRMSDQAEFSGFDDGTSEKTMNFILRDQKAQFGRVYGGYGDRDRYQSGGNATVVRGATRLTLLGLSNNVNQKNFSHQDLIGAMSGGMGGGPRMMMFGGGRPGGGTPQVIRMGGGFGGGSFDPGSFLVSQQPGLSTTHSGGLNYVDQFGPRLSVSASVFANDTDTENRQTLFREYLPPQDSLAFYDQAATTDSRNGNQRVDARIEWTPDSLNSVIVQPRLYFQRNRSDNLSDAANATAAGEPLSAASSDVRDRIDADNLSTRMTMRHRFGKRGRNVSAELNAGRTLRDGESRQRSLTEFFEDGVLAGSDTLDQLSASETTTNSLSARLAFTERLTSTLQLQATYAPGLTRSESDTRTHRLDPSTGEYSLPDSALSNSFENRTLTHQAGLAALWSEGPWKLLSRASWQRTGLRSEQTFPSARSIEKDFDDVLPSVTLTGSFANRRNLRLAYTTSVNAPAIGQLQNVVNNSNPLVLSTGNPGLRPSYNHTLSLRLSEADPARSRSRFVFANVTRTSHPIANATFTAAADTTVEGVFLARGTQLTRPENLDASWNANLFGVYSFPTGWLKSILSLNGGATFTSTPTRLNGVENVRDTWALRSGATLSSNISERLDFTVSYFGRYNLSRSDLTRIDTGDYYSHSAALRFNAVIGPGIVLRQEVTHLLQSGVPSAYGQDVVLWNSTLGKRLLKDGRGELKLTTTDVLQQDRAVGRNITDSYVEDSRDLTLGRYVQAVFTYSFGPRASETPGHMPGMIRPR